jgi:hypothetical protein
MNDLILTCKKLVRLLPLAAPMMPKRLATGNPWNSPRDFREICSCQRHARRERTLWRRAFRAAKRRGVALLVTVPLAFGAIGMEAMNVSLPALARAIEISGTKRPFPIFAATKFSEPLQNPERSKQALALDVSKEEFFRTQVPYGSIIYREALRNELPPELIAAVVESESDFRPRLVSNKDARGLMQIVPETARRMGCDDPFDPPANIAAGTRYLHYLMNRFGDERIALAAYNAGEGAVERLGGVPQYPETIAYLDRVAARVRLYRKQVQNCYVASVRQQASVIAR